MNPYRPAWRAIALALALLVAGPARAQAPLPPAEHFVGGGLWSQVAISPSGERLAVLLTDDKDRRVLATMPLNGPSQMKVIAAYDDADIDSVLWVNDERLVYDVRQPKYVLDEGGYGVFGIDHDGSDARELIGLRNDNQVTGTRFERRGIPAGWAVYGALDDGGDEVLARRYSFSAGGVLTMGGLARLNTRTARLRLLGQNVPAFARQWLLDAKGDLRVVATLDKGRAAVHWLPPGTEQWTRVLDQDALSKDMLSPRYLEDAQTLVVEGRLGGRDTEALYILDLRTGIVGPEPIAALDGFDTDASLEVDSRTRQVVGMHTRASRPLSLWFTDGMAKVQKAVDDALPAGRVNRLLCGRCESTPHFLVFSQSDRHPGEYLHFDRAKNSLRSLHMQRPRLDERTQGRRSFHRVAARDGLSLPVYVTHPQGQAPVEGKTSNPLPTVVHVHGGPWERGHDLGWEPHAQFLASRGWRVIEVEFRGSTGYGWRHFNAGWKTWGTAMQDDLADAVAWAVQQKLSDPARVCIFGASYGGYAALMAPIRHPGVFRCAASYAGVTDPGLLYTSNWGDMTAQSKRYSLPVLVGDPLADAPLLDAASPLKRVSELKVPVLLAYGSADRRVPREHAERFEAAARRANVPVETQMFFNEGHGFFVKGNHAAFLRKLEEFLARHMK